MATQNICHGETGCQGVYRSRKKEGQTCQNKAYFELNGQYLCGVHGKNGLPLPRNPAKRQMQKKKIDQSLDEIERQADLNYVEGYRGYLQVDKMRMRKEPPSIPGFLRVFPNFKHGGRKDGLGLPSLSPMSLGLVEHRMPNLPPASNIENYYQGAKIFDGEIGKDGQITLESKQSRVQMYLDPIPHRHKYETPYFTGLRGVKIPLFSVYYTEQGEERRYTYVESRYFYCHWYERLAKMEPDFQVLIQLLDAGYNLLIIGYDGFMIEGGNTNEIMWKHYLDTSKPFGHEAVLYCLLMIEDEEMYPWNRYHREHTDLYINLG